MPPNCGTKGKWTRYLKSSTQPCPALSSVLGLFLPWKFRLGFGIRSMRYNEERLFYGVRWQSEAATPLWVSLHGETENYSEVLLYHSTNHAHFGFATPKRRRRPRFPPLPPQSKAGGARPNPTGIALGEDACATACSGSRQGYSDPIKPSRAGARRIRQFVHPAAARHPGLR